MDIYRKNFGRLSKACFRLWMEEFHTRGWIEEVFGAQMFSPPLFCYLFFGPKPDLSISTFFELIHGAWCNRGYGQHAFAFHE
jgi:hypothetical protein